MIKIDHDMAEEKREKFYHLLETVSANGAMISTSLGDNLRYEATAKGLQSAHAYSLTKVVDVSRWYSRDKIQLLRLRNPHGDGSEWKGDWSDQCEQWNKISNSMKKTIGLDKSSDGEFYICIQDFVKYFGRVELLHLTPMRMLINEKKLSQKFTMISIYGKWQRGVSDGGTANYGINPQYRMTLVNKRDSSDCCNLVISLTQKLPRRKSEKSIGFRLYKVGSEHKDEKVLSPRFINNGINMVDNSGAFINSREVTFRNYK